MEHGQSTVFMLMGTCGQKALVSTLIKAFAKMCFLILLKNGFVCKKNKAVYSILYMSNGLYPEGYKPFDSVN